MTPDWNVILAGAVGVGVGGALNYAGLWVQRRTAVDTKNIDDRSKFTEDLMEQLEKVQEDFNKYREEQRAQFSLLSTELSDLKRREQKFFRIALIVEADLRILNMHLMNHCQELKDEHTPKPILLQRAEMILTHVEKIRETIADGQSLLIDKPN